MIVNILENFLGTPKSHYEGKSQVQFDCPKCEDGKGKGNLEVNYAKGVYKCWACWERNNMRGNVVKLIKQFGNKQNLKDYLLVAPAYIYKKVEYTDIPDKVFLPKTYKKFSEATIYDKKYKEAYDYVKGRGLTDEMLERYKVGFTNDGKKKNRIIIPSYTNGELNYYIARSFEHRNNFKYLNPDAKKELIIFNEELINWDATIYLVEGAFDHIVTPNSIPLLGKFISDKLFFELQTRAKGKVVLVLDGGEEEREDALKLYARLNTAYLYDRIRVVNIPDKWDLSLINQKFGVKPIINYLRTAFKIRESRL